MNIETFKVEEWMNEYEKEAVYDIAQTCVKNLSLEELFELTNTHKDKFFEKICKTPLGYGHILGSPNLKKGISALYEFIDENHILPTIGAAGANHLVFYSLVNPDDRIISVLPTYQQLYSIPKSFGADVQILKLKPENGFMPDIDELKKLVNEKTKLICINNPNNPAGALIDEKRLEKIVEIAKTANAYLLCDEVYRGLNHEAVNAPSIADMYEKGISTCSMSKVFSLAGVRLGWIASNSEFVIKECQKHREYNMISLSQLDEAVSALALDNANILLERNRKIIKENIEILDDWVKKEPHISYVKPKAGTTALLYYDIKKSSKEVCDELSKKYGVFLTPGFCFELENCFRIGYCGDKKVLIKGLELISEYFRNV